MYTNGPGSIIPLTKRNLFMSVTFFILKKTAFIKIYFFKKSQKCFDLPLMVTPFTFSLKLIGYVQSWTWTITIVNCFSSKWLIYINKLRNQKSEMFGNLKNSRVELSDSSILRKQWEVRTPKLWIRKNFGLEQVLIYTTSIVYTVSIYTISLEKTFNSEIFPASSQQACIIYPIS